MTPVGVNAEAARPSGTTLVRSSPPGCGVKSPGDRFARVEQAGSCTRQDRQRKASETVKATASPPTAPLAGRNACARTQKHWERSEGMNETVDPQTDSDPTEARILCHFGFSRSTCCAAQEKRTYRGCRSINSACKTPSARWSKTIKASRRGDSADGRGDAAPKSPSSACPSALNRMLCA